MIGGDGGHRKTVSAIGRGHRVPPLPHRLRVLFRHRRQWVLLGGEGVGFLRDLLRHLPGRVVVVWDGGGNHKGPVIRAFLARNTRLRRVRLAGVRPDL